MDTNEKENVKKSNLTTILLIMSIVLLLVAIVGTCWYGYAKFITSKNGAAQAQIAQFHFELKNINGDSTTTAQSGIIDFPITRTDGNSKIATGKLAPETFGRFDMIIDGTGSNVAYRYDLNVTVTNCPQNLKFYTDKEHTQPITTTRTQATIGGQTVKTATFTISKYVPLNRVNEEHKEIVYWEWPYETGTGDNEVLANDIIDSQDMEKTVTMTIEAVGTQVSEQPQGIAVVGANPDSAVANKIQLTDNTVTLKSGQSATVDLSYDGDTTNLEALSVRSNDDQVATVSLANNEITITANSITTASTTVEVYGENSMVQKTITVNVTGVQVGDTINYTPSGTYGWNKTLATSDETGIVTLSSASGQDCRISTWYVLSVSGNNITMVPTAPSSGTVRLQGAQGYNNAVKLLNDACSSLYGDPSKKITARSIREEDFVEAGKKSQAGDSELVNDWTRNRAEYTSHGQYDNQLDSAYGKIYSYYPYIYVQENKSVIDEEETSSDLGRSEQVETIAKGTTDGCLQANISIQPYQTFYHTNNYSATLELLESDKASSLLPNSSICYWVASRCVDLYPAGCGFDIVRIYAGWYVPLRLLLSDSTPNSAAAYGLFPVVSLHADNLETTSTTGTYNVK